MYYPNNYFASQEEYEIKEGNRPAAKAARRPTKPPCSNQ